MEDRNIYLEMDGLYWQSDTHEWFHDHGGTNYAQQEDQYGISLPHLVAFVVRDKSSGEYNRVVMDKRDSSIIYDTKSLEDMGGFIDKAKVLIRFGLKREVKKRKYTK